MINFPTRIASLVLAFGFFISCSTLEPNQQTTPSTDKSLTESEIHNQLDSVDEQLKNDADDAELFYRKGELLTKLANKQAPSDRGTIYGRAHSSLARATELFTGTPEASSEKAQELLKVTWSNEHNQGVQVLQTDTSGAAPSYELAASHFENATTIIPDSAVSYKMGAKAMYKNQQPERAIQILEDARTAVDRIPSEMLEQLAFLYLETGQTQNAVAVYEEAESFSDQNLNLLHGLSNAYISSGEHQQAAELLQQLIEQKPENVIYGQSLAKEFYFLGADKLKDVTARLRSGQPLEASGFPEADSLMQAAQDRFSKTLSKNPKDQDLTLSFAQFYQNSASKYQQLLPYVETDNKSKVVTKIKQYVTKSIPLLEQLAGQRPDAQGVWKNLYQAYSYLGMQDKAQNAKSNL
jgi:tetratricopeptide (TPR) repeat protein